MTLSEFKTGNVVPAVSLELQSLWYDAKGDWIGLEAEQERQRAEEERQRAERERDRAERLAERLRQAGIDPEEI